MTENLMTGSQAAELLNVPLSWIYAKSETGELPSIKIGRYRRFVRAELEAWLARQRESASHGSRQEDGPSGRGPGIRADKQRTDPR